MEIKVMTFNIHHGKGTDKKVNLNRIAEVIRRSNPDVIGLNEVDKHFSKRSLFVDQAGWLANELNMDFVFSPSISIQSNQAADKGQYGNALLSRYPIFSKEIHLFKYQSRLNENRSLIDASIIINGQLVQFNVTHLSLNPFLHRKQIDYLVNQSQKYSHPIIIMGDLNMKPGSIGWLQLTQQYKDAWKAAGNGPGSTYPSRNPKNRLDYIYASPFLKVREAEVVSQIPAASDHLPLTATLSS